MKSFISIAMLCAVCMTTAYFQGRHDELRSRDSYQETLIAACQEDNRILQHRYDMLASESDWLVVVDSERRYQEGGHGE
jgi:hypothetical protein